MKNLSIGAKLMASFAVLAMALLILGGISIRNQANLGSVSADLGGRLAKLQKLTHSIDTQTSNFRAEEMTHIVSATPQEMAPHEKAMRAAQTSIDDMLAQVNAEKQDPTAQAAMRDFGTAWQGFTVHVPQTLALSRQNLDEQAQASALKEIPDYNAQNEALGRAEEAYTAAMTRGVDDAAATAASGRTITLAVLVLVAGVTVALLMLLVRQIAKPLAVMTGAMGELAAGNMAVAVPDDGRRDEVGALAQAMGKFRDQLGAAERAKVEQTRLIVDSVGKGLAGLAEGDLVSRIEVDLTGAFAQLKTDFNAAAASLQATMTQMADAASGINTGAAEIRHASDDLSQRTEQQAASLEETAAAMDQITTNVRTTAARAGQANQAVSQARDEAERSGGVVRNAVSAMEGIERTSNEISEIIAVIDGIAFQTNLLALNAGVEAARAGDAGKGFAVVASEVRALAQRSAEAAKDVKARITASSQQVASGVQLVGETGQALGRIIERIGEISGLVAEISTSADQQASGLQEVNTAVGEMDGVTQQNAAMVEQATAAARSLASEADGMTRQIARFRTGEGAPAPASPVHQLQQRAAVAGRQIARAAPRRGGGAAAAAAVPAVSEDDWSQF